MIPKKANCALALEPERSAVHTPRYRSRASRLQEHIAEKLRKDPWLWRYLCDDTPTTSRQNQLIGEGELTMMRGKIEASDQRVCPRPHAPM